MYKLQARANIYLSGVVIMSKFIGALIGVVVDVLGHLIAAIFERQSFFDRLISIQGIIILIALILFGLIVGVVLEKSHQSTSSSTASGNSKDNSVRQKIDASGGEVIGSPQSVEGHNGDGKKSQIIIARNKGKVKGSGQSIK